MYTQPRRNEVLAFPVKNWNGMPVDCVTTVFDLISEHALISGQPIFFF